MTSNASLLFKKVALWQKAGQVSASDQSISTRIGEAALAREISALDKKAMLEFKDELKVAVACLKMADSFATARRTRNPKTAAEAETLDALTSIARQAPCGPKMEIVNDLRRQFAIPAMPKREKEDFPNPPKGLG